MSDDRIYGVFQLGNWLGELHLLPNGKVRTLWWDSNAPHKAVRLTIKKAEAMAGFVGSSAEVRRIPA